MKFTFEARNEQGELGLLTVVRRGRELEYWEFKRAKEPDEQPEPEDTLIWVAGPDE